MQCGKAHHAEYIYDSAHAFKPTPGSLSEARAACAAENQGLYKKLVRSLDSSYDFVDELGNKVDVKRVISKYIDKNFSFEIFVEELTEEIKAGEYILMDLSQASNLHILELKNVIQKIMPNFEKSRVKFITY